MYVDTTAVINKVCTAVFLNWRLPLFLFFSPLKKFQATVAAVGNFSSFKEIARIEFLAGAEESQQASQIKKRGGLNNN
jgi:hypothetical protein